MGFDERLTRSRDVSPDRFERFQPTNPNLEPTLVRAASPEVEYDKILTRRLASRGSSRHTERLRTPTIASENKQITRARTADARMQGRPPWRDVAGWEGQEAGPTPDLPPVDTYDFLNDFDTSM